MSAVVDLIDAPNDRDYASTLSLCCSAHCILNVYAARGCSPLELTPSQSLDVEKVLRAILDASKICGGTRYVAAAIVLAAGKGDLGSNNVVQGHVGADGDHVKERLVAPARDWVNAFLWPFWSAYQHADPLASQRSQRHACPQIGSRTKKLAVWPDNRPSTLREEVLMRDNYQCVLKGVMDNDTCRTGRITTTGVGFRRVVATRIIRRSLFPKNDSSPLSQISAKIDILQYFAGLSGEAMDELAASIDTPENVITLNRDWHDEFDRFEWCLVPHGVDLSRIHDVFDPDLDELPELSGQQHYKFVALEPLDCNTVSNPSDKVTFVNHALPAERTFKFPNPKLLAIHAAIAHVLHFSGAGDVFSHITT
ncbi:hypothetical protein EIP91_004955 [Steccherinum ochraceum]|uniref:HNH nuclease domain-containing protein n=1 Tax=Steccherinum ochraceum TaxID=92696 RepID=A0A4R0R8H6_9APHY|nr:hypothetical protein EIP91_004955 [Steccherinum ochraceum]